MTVDLRHLRCFVAVAEDLNFRRAARKLGVAQPALSRTIKNLETALGFALFDRSNRRVELTAAGQSFLKGSHAILLKTQTVIEDAHRVHQGKTGSLRIGYTENAMAGVGPGLLRQFQHERPDIALHLQHAVTARQLAMLEDGTLDFGFVTDTGPRAGLEAFCIQTERFVCVVYDGHPFCGREAVRLRDLATAPLIRGIEAHWQHFNANLMQLFGDAGVEPQFVHEGLTTSDIQRLVACGIGISVLTDTVIDTLAPGLQVLPIADVHARLGTTVVWSAQRQQSAAFEHFAGFIGTAFGTAPP